MDWVTDIQSTVNYIEDHIKDKVTLEELAGSIYTSTFYYQKMFTLLCNCTVSEYIRNRRLTLAGYEVIDAVTSIMDLAIDYQYETNESFTRAFTRFHGITPSEARKTQANLQVFSRIDIKSNLSGGKGLMSKLCERGYVVRETGAVYHTMDMDKTLEWFQKILGWYGQIESRDGEGLGLYGCVNHIPMEMEALHIAPFTGIHLFKGEPEERVVGFMLITGVDNLYKFIKLNGWNKVTEVKEEVWGGKTCSVTTIDGCVLTFFEV